jgi:ribosome-associated protein
MIPVTSDIILNDNELRFSFIHASGPGGQHINKVATAVQLRFNITNSPALPEDIKSRLITLGGKRITGDGELIITARRFRTQERNKQDAIKRLTSLVRKASTKPKPRYKATPTKASIEKRLKTKQHRKEVKQRRQSVDPFEDT